MKTCLLAGLLLTGTAHVALSQGAITFGNNLPTLRAPIFGTELDWINHGGDWADAKTGNTSTGIPAGAQVYQGSPVQNFIVRFWAAPGIVTDGHLLEQGSLSTMTGSGVGAGFFPTSLITFANLPATGVATAQVRIYDPSGTLTFGFDSSGGVSAASALFQVNIGTTATGLRSFSIGWLDPDTLAPYVPEPTSGALLLLGFGIFVARKHSS